MGGFSPFHARLDSMQMEEAELDMPKYCAVPGSSPSSSLGTQHRALEKPATANTTRSKAN